MSGYPFARGSFVSAGVAHTVEVGFRPKYINIFNSLGDTAQYLEGMAAASLQKNGYADGVGSISSTNGITLTATGFTLGTDAVNASTERIYWMAWG